MPAAAVVLRVVPGDASIFAGARVKTHAGNHDLVVSRPTHQDISAGATGVVLDLRR